jgi:hypothetical protein
MIARRLLPAWLAEHGGRYLDPTASVSEVWASFKEKMSGSPSARERVAAEGAREMVRASQLSAELSAAL